MAMYKEIAQFLSASPEWIENWISTPVKAKYRETPLNIAEIILNIINHLPFTSYMNAIKLNSVWSSAVYKDLRLRQEKLVRKYWDLVAEKNKVWNELNHAHDRADCRAGSFLTPEIRKLSEKFEKLCVEKGEIFAEQVIVEQTFLTCGFADETEREKIWRHINLLNNGYGPDDVGWTETNETVYHWDDESDANPLEYWNDEDPDI